MADEEPLDDARHVATAAAAAGARVTETAVRAAQDHALRVDEQRRRTEANTRQHGPDDAGRQAELQRLRRELENRQRAQDAADPDRARRMAELGQAETWASPDRREAFRHDLDRAMSESAEAVAAVEGDLVQEWRTATWDTPESRAGRDEALAAAGVPEDARAARWAADVCHTTDPALSVAQPATAPKASPIRVTIPIPDRTLGR